MKLLITIGIAFLYFQLSISQPASLASNELQIMNKSGKTVTLECSHDRSLWHTRVLKDNYSFDVTTKNDTFSVKICQTIKLEENPKCVIYHLKPLTRYVIRIDKQGLFKIYYKD